jgi:hypothetical protein
MSKNLDTMCNDVNCQYWGGGVPRRAVGENTMGSTGCRKYTMGSYHNDNVVPNGTRSQSAGVNCHYWGVVLRKLQCASVAHTMYKSCTHHRLWYDGRGILRVGEAVGITYQR